MPDDKSCEVTKLMIEALKEQWNIRFIALEKAISKSEELLKLRLEEMNNFRRQITDERVSYVTRRETVLLNFIISIIVVFFGAILTYLLMS
jgi:preprotein translocase subunit SecE